MAHYWIAHQIGWVTIEWFTLNGMGFYQIAWLTAHLMLGLTQGAWDILTLFSLAASYKMYSISLQTKYGNFVNWVKKKKNISVHSSYINIVTDWFKLTSFHPTIILKMCLLSLCSCQNSFDWLKNSLLSYFAKPDMIGQEKSWVCEQQLRMFRLWSSFSEQVLSALSHFLNGEDLKSLALTFC